jgi:hypothetical protein
VERLTRSNQKLKRQLDSEISVMKTLQHDHIVALHEVIVVRRLSFSLSLSPPCRFEPRTYSSSCADVHHRPNIAASRQTHTGNGVHLLGTRVLRGRRLLGLFEEAQAQATKRRHGSFLPPPARYALVCARLSLSLFVSSKEPPLYSPRSPAYTRSFRPQVSAQQKHHPQVAYCVVM